MGNWTVKGSIFGSIFIVSG